MRNQVAGEVESEADRNRSAARADEQPGERPGRNVDGDNHDAPA